MELRKGMYVITNDRMEIGKIKDFCTCEMCKKRGFYEPIIDNPNIFITIHDKEICFHGYKFYENIIDLIEVGDYVNGEKVQYITKKRQLLTNGGYDILEKYTGISSVVTKEQFESMKYVVEE